MGTPEKPVTILTEDECFERLKTHNIGRIVTSVGDVIDIVPLNYVLDEGTIVFRTAAGSKLNELTINPRVILEVDDINEQFGWSVVVHGIAERLQTSREIEAAEALPLKPMIGTLKLHYVRITPTRVTGRTFEFGEEPDRDAFQEG